MDIDLNFQDFIARVNSDLIGKITNIASRSAQLREGSPAWTRWGRPALTRSNRSANTGARIGWVI
jgi:hypothetical protein